MSQLTLTSPAFENGGVIPQKYTCDGENMSPPLMLENVPEGTMSLALVMDDPDVPAEVRPEQMFDHWVLFNLSPDLREIKENDFPGGIMGKNTSGELGYTGPCPPRQFEPSEHRYVFRVYALDTVLELDEGVDKAALELAMEGHIISEAELIGRYKRV